MHLTSKHAVPSHFRVTPGDSDNFGCVHARIHCPTLRPMRASTHSFGVIRMTSSALYLLQVGSPVGALKGNLVVMIS
jgi:hypothetical protein